MKVWILGSGTLLPDPHRGPPGYWVEVAGGHLLLDCGSGSLRTLARLGLPWHQVSHVVLSHFHTDHVADLAPLLFALKHSREPARRETLHILGPQGLKEHLEYLAGAHGPYILDPGFPLHVEEVRPERVRRDPGGSFSIRAFPTFHTDSALAYRIESLHGTLGYTGDTGPVEGLAEFLAGSDLLLAECSNPDGEEMDNHLTPGRLAALARQASPKLLVNVHAYPPLDPGVVPDLLRKKGYTGGVRAGCDGLEIRILPSGVGVRSPASGV